MEQRFFSYYLDSILGQKFKVLDDGFIRVVDYMGTDDSIVQAARVSYGKGTKKTSTDSDLIRYLMRHEHMTPFEMCQLKLHIRIPMDAWRQMVRHRMCSVNEYSTRYSEAIDSMQKTNSGQWRKQSQNNKQGSDGNISNDYGIFLSGQESDFHDQARKIYISRLKVGVAREQARKDLPLSTYTEAYWCIDLRNLLHFLDLRMRQDAQQEIRQYAQAIGENVVKHWVPITWEAFMDYAFRAKTLSSKAISVHAAMITYIKDGQLDKLVDEFGMLDLIRKRENDKIILKREGLEILETMSDIGFEPPSIFFPQKKSLN